MAKKKNTEPEFSTTSTGQPVLGPLSLSGDLIAYENGELDDEQVIQLFQNLIDTGLAWTLQGSYGRTAAQFIEAGVCHPKEN